MFKRYYIIEKAGWFSDGLVSKKVYRILCEPWQHSL